MPAPLELLYYKETASGCAITQTVVAMRLYNWTTRDWLSSCNSYWSQCATPRSTVAFFHPHPLTTKSGRFCVSRPDLCTAAINAGHHTLVNGLELAANALRRHSIDSHSPNCLELPSAAVWPFQTNGWLV